MKTSRHKWRIANRPQAFTLIELLVVVAIIAVLVSILLPALNAARDQAKLTICASNLKQLHMAVWGYVQDYGDCLPPSGVTRAWVEVHPRWNDALRPYVSGGDAAQFYYGSGRQDPLIFRCPLRPDVDMYGYARSYAYNMDLHWSGERAAKLDRVGGPDKTPLFFDGASYACNAWIVLDSLSVRTEMNRHNGGANWLFVDGNARWIEQLERHLYYPPNENEFFYGVNDPDSYWR